MFDYSAGPEGYGGLIRRILRVYRGVKSPEDLLTSVGMPLLDITQTREQQAMARANPLPPGFSLDVFTFEDRKYGPVVFDFSFHQCRLVNVRAQLFIEGWFKKRLLRRCLEDEILPALGDAFGAPASYAGPALTFAKGGLICVLRQGDPGPFLSVGITDQEFAT